MLYFYNYAHVLQIQSFYEYNVNAIIDLRWLSSNMNQAWQQESKGLASTSLRSIKCLYMQLIEK